VGLGVQALARPPLSSRWRLWSWRRRILQVATVAAPVPGGPGGPAAGGDDAFTLVNVHLTPHGQVALRAIETATVLATVAEHSGPVVVCGDFNERPGGAIHRQLAAAGLRDGAGDGHGDDDQPVPEGERPPDPAPTNWRGWRRGTEKAPTQRLDYVYVSPAVAGCTVTVAGVGASDLGRFAAISDHLPVTAAIDLGTSADTAATTPDAADPADMSDASDI
jgi:hypothetical protein